MPTALSKGEACLSVLVMRQADYLIMAAWIIQKEAGE